MVEAPASSGILAVDLMGPAFPWPMAVLFPRYLAGRDVYPHSLSVWCKPRETRESPVVQSLRPTFLVANPNGRHPHQSFPTFPSNPMGREQHDFCFNPCPEKPPISFLRASKKARASLYGGYPHHSQVRTLISME
ncbi:hypothetical protein DM02DRAFT_609186 [Periconia macrospinosa]|uniref:Uncharacterized protein n=1 Tax=Periconia macrospinosa TaxID=97972 RepID=A0A2V1EA23_9PLEO|nr:hypothetical protein DM02DRAFT_609186 [Periconia macrospinosa]